MGVIVPIVEGDGEVEALPNLLIRLLHRHSCFDLFVARPKNAHGCGNLTTPGGIERFVRLALFEPQCEGILVLLDADDSCACSIANGLAKRIEALNPQKPVAFIAAKCEYEAWFLASLPTITGKLLDGRPGLKQGLTYPDDRVESLVGVKGWLSRNFQGGRIYKETLDQLPMTRFIDFDMALPKSRSLRRLEHAVIELIENRNIARFISPF